MRATILAELESASDQSITGLLALPSIRRTVNPESMHVPQDWYTEMAASPEWESRWKRIARYAYGTPGQDGITRHPIRNPIRYLPLDEETSPIDVQHAYHLFAFEKMTGQPLATATSQIIDIGAGFGNMCRVLRRAGFGGQYIAYDAPFMSRIQSKYIRSGTAEFLSSIDATYERSVRHSGKTAFLATWSISEMPLDLRNRIFPRFLDTCDLFLIAYPPTSFEGIDNEAYFTGVRAMRSDISWSVKQNTPCTSHYMIGVRHG
jgi:hypothetical protein